MPICEFINCLRKNLRIGLRILAFMVFEVKTNPIPTGAFSTDLILQIFAAIEPYIIGLAAIW